MNHFNITVFIHVRNEEELLPHWLLHHKGMFDHGVVIDYYSTDNTRKIINTICPTWEIVEPIEPFGPCCMLIEHFEVKYSGWKIALNVTEFLFIDNLRKFIIDFEKKHPDMNGIRTRGCVLVDTMHTPVIPNKPLVLQYTNGYFEEDLINYIDHNDNSRPEIWNTTEEHLPKTAKLIQMGIDGRSRLLHKCASGRYLQGRHTTMHTNIYPRNTNTCVESDLILLWAGFAPYSILKSRYNKTTSTNLRLYNLNKEKLIQYHGKISYDLCKDKRYLEMLNTIKKIYQSS